MISCNSCLFIAGLLVITASASSAQAQLARTYVSSFGNDANNCDRPTPCRTFQHAHDQTLALGEITVLDPGGYGAVTITKGISIINDGVGEAGVLVSGGLVGITVTAGAGDRVSLRGLTIKGIGFGGGNGIRFNSGFSLTVENCVVRNHTGDGIQMLGTLASNAVSRFTLSNTLVSDNGGNGIFIAPSGSGQLRIMLTRVEMYDNNANGVALSALQTTTGGFLEMTVADSVAAHNGGGVAVDAGDPRTHATTHVGVFGSVLATNGIGISSQAPFVVIGSSIIHANGQGWSGTLGTFGDNYWLNNHNNDFPPSIVFSKG